MSEYWMFYAVQTSRVIFTAKTSLVLFSPGRKQVWTYSVLGDRIYEMMRIKPRTDRLKPIFHQNVNPLTLKLSCCRYQNVGI